MDVILLWLRRCHGHRLLCPHHFHPWLSWLVLGLLQPLGCPELQHLWYLLLVLASLLATGDSKPTLLLLLVVVPSATGDPKPTLLLLVAASFPATEDPKPTLLLLVVASLLAAGDSSTLNGHLNSQSLSQKTVPDDPDHR